VTGFSAPTGIRFVVLNGLGHPLAGVPADEETLAAVLDDLARLLAH
jgi:hypothetical protein